MTTADRWIDALHDTSQRLAETVRELTPDDLAAPSYVEGWSVGQVLSHLGSGAEICLDLVERGLAGETRGPNREDLLRIWARWDSMTPTEQRDNWLRADQRHRDLLDSLDEGQRETVSVPYFAGLLDVEAYAGYRLSEQSVHAWDIAVALDPSAAVPPTETGLLWERIDAMAGRFSDADTRARLAPQRIRIKLTDTGRSLFLDIDNEVHIHPLEPADPTGSLAGPAEAVLRLLYGRNRPQDPLTTDGPVTGDDLRALFPGF